MIIPMKKILTVIGFALFAVTAQAAGLSGKKIYIDPGHGSYGSNDRPNPTIPYPTPSAAKGKSFYESNTNLWKCEKLEEMLKAAGAKTSMSHRECGGTTDGTSYNPSLSARRTEATNWGADFFISVHSNAATEGTETNFLYLALRGDANATSSIQKSQRASAETCWPYVFEFMGESDEGYVHEPHTHYSYTNMKIETQSLGVLRHSITGFLSEGFFHTYQPSRHRALNKDWCRQEGLRYYRGIAKKYGQADEKVGYIMGVVKRSDKKMTRSSTLKAGQFYYKTGSHDQFYPCNGAKVYLYNSSKSKIKTYTVDNNWNGVFVFENLEPGTYYLGVEYSGCGNLPNQYREVKVTAHKTVYPVCLVKSGTYSQDTENAFLGVTSTTNPTIKSSTSAVNLSAVKGAATPTKAVTITASHLTADMKITKTSADIEHITSNWNARTGGTLTFSRSTANVGTFASTITISSGSASVEIHVTATITEGSSTPAEEVKAGTITFNEEWVKKVANATYLNTGTNDNRSMSYYNGSIYIPNKTAGTFTIINATDGTKTATKTIGTSRFGHNNLRITTDGKMLLGNTEAATKTTAGVAVLGSDISAGGETVLGSATIGGRSDYFYTYGDWNKSGYIIALTNENDSNDATMAHLDMAFVKIPFTNGTLGTASFINARNATLPASYASAKAIPADATSFYASAIGVAPTLHDVTTGDFIDGWGDEKPVQDTDYPTSGVGVFTIHGHKYLVTPLNRFGKFEIYEVTYGLSKATKVKEVGTVDEIGRANGNGLATVDIATAVSGNDVFIYVFAPHNGLAAYKFTFTPTTSTVTGPTTPDVIYGNVNFFLQGGTLEVPADNEALWRVMGPQFDVYYPNAYKKYSEGKHSNISNITNFLYVNYTKTGYAEEKVITDTNIWTAADGPWKWLGDYMQAHTNNGISTLVHWRFTTDGFFQQRGTTANQVGDWTEAGKPEAWAAAYMFSHKPTKTNDEFLGWYGNAAGIGSPLQNLPTSGNVYACWRYTPVTSLEDVQHEVRLLPTFSGVEILFEGTQTITIYNINGIMVASGVSTDYYTCDLGAGLYIIRVGNEVHKFVK